MEGGPAVNDNDWTRIARQMPDLEALPLWMDYTPRVTPGLVRTRIKALTRQTGQVPLVIIDYV
jgi:replicative DNA helicase